MACAMQLKVLDIGCGWGCLAKYASENHGVSVVGITISEQQLELGRELCLGLPVELVFKDYRDLLKSDEQFDRIVSIGMFEHVGSKNYSTYMQAVSNSLKKNGLFLLHTIGTNTSKNHSSRWIDTYIFSNGEIPTISRIAKSFEGIFVMEDWGNYGVHYDKTLMAWHKNFNDNWDQLTQVR